MPSLRARFLISHFIIFSVALQSYSISKYCLFSEWIHISFTSSLENRLSVYRPGETFVIFEKLSMQRNISDDTMIYNCDIGDSLKHSLIMLCTLTRALGNYVVNDIYSNSFL